jgi:hypothetical protein
MIESGVLSSKFFSCFPGRLSRACFLTWGIKYSKNHITRFQSSEWFWFHSQWFGLSNGICVDELISPMIQDFCKTKLSITS